jgi:hypothetical protein
MLPWQCTIDEFAHMTLQHRPTRFDMIPWQWTLNSWLNLNFFTPLFVWHYEFIKRRPPFLCFSNVTVLLGDQDTLITSLPSSYIHCKLIGHDRKWVGHETMTWALTSEAVGHATMTIEAKKLVGHDTMTSMTRFVEHVTMNIQCHILQNRELVPG